VVGQFGTSGREKLVQALEIACRFEKVFASA